jgi:hypothetical protein
MNLFSRFFFGSHATYFPCVVGRSCCFLYLYGVFLAATGRSLNLALNPSKLRLYYVVLVTLWCQSLSSLFIYFIFFPTFQSHTTNDISYSCRLFIFMPTPTSSS